MVNDYRLTIYDDFCSDFAINKSNLEQEIKKDHPQVIDLHTKLRDNNGDYKLRFIESYNGRCAYCGVSIDLISRTQFQVDHFLPYSDKTRFKSKKEAGYMSNLVLACQDCNFNKHDYRIPDDYMDVLHPDKETILEVFKRDDNYYIRVSDKYTDDKEIIHFYNQLRLGNETHRLDYLLLNMIGFRQKHRDDDRLCKLDFIINKLIKKRNIGAKRT